MATKLTKCWRATLAVENNLDRIDHLLIIYKYYRTREKQGETRINSRFRSIRQLVSDKEYSFAQKSTNAEE